jgi:patatin-like phospholipase/acyl hydrolase
MLDQKILESIGRTLTRYGDSYALVFGNQGLIAERNVVQQPWMLSTTSQRLFKLVIVPQVDRFSSELVGVFGPVYRSPGEAKIGLRDSAGQTVVVEIPKDQNAAQRQDWLSFLTEIFHEFGVVIAGFDADDSQVLTDALISAPNHFYSSYWLLDRKLTDRTLSVLRARDAKPVFVSDFSSAMQMIAANSADTSVAGSRIVETKFGHVVPTSILSDPDRLRMESASLETERQVIKVLSIDGGGIRGVIPATILSELENACGKPVHKLFDVIAGTSTGGILALGLSLPGEDGNAKYTASDLNQMYLEDGPNIFPQTQARIHPVACWLARLIAPFNQKYANLLRSAAKQPYESTGIEHVLQEYFLDTTLSDLLCDVLVTAYDIEARATHVYTSRMSRIDPRENLMAREVARATSAAPSYFRPFQKTFPNRIPTRDVLIDGGLFANNPTICAYLEAKTLFRAADRFLVLSLGTGEDPRGFLGEEASNWVAAQWVQKVIEILMHGTSRIVHENMQHLLPTVLGNRSYYRFQPSIADCSEEIDNVETHNINQLARAAKHCIEHTNKADFDQLVHALRLSS